MVERDTDARHILHLGTMYWPPNIQGVEWFVKEVYPRVRSARPDVQFDVVGARPPATLLALNHADMGIHVAGFVKDPTSFTRQAALMVVPLLAGGGMRAKILHALAQGLPIVSTSLGCEGIGVSDGCHLLVGDDPERFAGQVLRLLDDPALGRKLAANGRALVEQDYDYRSACRPLEAIYARAMGAESAGLR